MSDLIMYRTRPASSDPEGVLVLIHGRGADENDLFPLFDILDPDRRLLGIAPRGPLSLPPGGAHWYEVRRVGFPEPDTFHPTFQRLERWLAELLASNDIPPERGIVGGFSQGAVMAYALGLAQGRPRPAGLLAFSGFLPTVEGFELDLADRRDLKVAIGHGSYDPIIGVEWGRDARDRLLSAGASVIYRESAMPHAIDPDFLRDLVPFVRTLGAEWLSDDGLRGFIPGSPDAAP